MAKSKGSAGRAGRGTARLPREWVATKLEKWGNYDNGGWWLSPEGELYDINKVTGAGGNAIHLDAAVKIDDRMNWPSDGRSSFNRMMDHGWGTVRLWETGIIAGTPTRVVSMRLTQTGTPALRMAQRIMDKLSDWGVNIYQTNVEVAFGASGYGAEGVWNGKPANLMDASSWRDLIGLSG